MSGKRAAAISFGLILDLAARLDDAGVPPDRAPSFDQCLDMVWPLAKRLARLERTAKDAGAVAARARSRLLDVVTEQVAGARLVPVSGDMALPPETGAGQLPAGEWARWESELAAAGESEAV